jgi:hypothetical protein
VTSPEKDRAYLEAGIPELGDYLLSNELYWPITARGFDLPRLTIGGILLAQTRLEARGERIESLVTQLGALRSKWRVAWETKASREVRARLRLWNNYLTDYRHNPEAHADAYPQEVHNLVMLAPINGRIAVAAIRAGRIFPVGQSITCQFIFRRLHLGGRFATRVSP